MTDREMVIKALGCFCDGEEKPEDCPCEFSIGNGHGCEWSVAKNAIFLLKEQGKLKSSLPTLIKNDKDQNEYWLICGFCKHKIDALFRFCPYCGREIELT